MKHQPAPERPWQHLSIDYYGPTPDGAYFFVLVDLYSRFPIVRHVKNTKSQSAIKVLDSILSEYGNVKRIDTDNGAPFNSELWSEFLRTRGIKHHRITPLWP